MNIADNLEHLETQYIKIWIKKWEQQIEETDSEEARAQLKANIEKAHQEIENRGQREQ